MLTLDKEHGYKNRKKGDVVLKEINITNYQLTEHFAVRAYERFGIDSIHLRSWLENYRYLVDTGLDASNDKRSILAAADGTTFVINREEKTIVTCYQGISPLASLRMQYDIFEKQLHAMEQAKIEVLKTYHRQYETVFDHLMQLHHNVTVDVLDDFDDYDETIKAIHHMQRLYHRDCTKLDAYIEKLQGVLKNFADDIVRVEMLAKQSNPQQVLSEEGTTEEVKTVPADTTPMHWNPFEYFQLGDRNMSPILESPISSSDSSPLIKSATVQLSAKRASTYEDCMTEQQLEEFRDYLQKTFPQEQPNKSQIMIVVRTMPIEQVPASLKKIAGIGDSRKKQIVTWLEENSRGSE